MNRFRVMIFLLIPVCAFALGPDNESKSLNALNWMLGEWTSEGDTKTTTEIWEKTSSETFEGKGFVYDKTLNKIISKETLRLVVMSNEIFYIAKVSHNEYPIAFKLTSFKKDTALFENTTHDFPKIIEYRLVDKNKITVSVGDDEKKFKIIFLRNNTN